MNAFRDGFKKIGFDTRTAEAYADVARHLHNLGVAAFDDVVAQAKRDMRTADPELRKSAEVINTQRFQPTATNDRRHRPNVGCANKAAAAATATAALVDVIWHTTRLCGRPLASWKFHELHDVIYDKNRVLKTTLFERRLAELILNHARPNGVTALPDGVSTTTLRQFVEEAAKYNVDGMAALERLKNA